MKDTAFVIELSQEDIETALRITPIFYDALLSPDRWQIALKAVIDWFPNTKSAAFHMFNYPDISKQYFHVNCGFTEDETARYMAFEDRLNGDPRTKPFLEVHPNQPVHCRMLVTDEEWYASPIYNEVFRPSKIDHSLIFATFLENETVLFSSGIFRNEGGEPYTECDLAKFQLLVPHLRRVCAVYARLANQERQNQRLSDILNAIDLATILINETGVIVGGNSQAQKILNEAGGLANKNNKLVHDNIETQKLLYSAIKDVVSSVSSGNDPRVNHLEITRCSAPQIPLKATVCSLAGNTENLSGWVTDQMTVAVFLTDPLVSYENQVEQLQQLHGLTLAEAKILTSLADGQRVREIAEQSKRSVETVRTHIKNLMSKMGVSRQADLVRLVLSSSSGPVT